MKAAVWTARQVWRMVLIAACSSGALQNSASAAHPISVSRASVYVQPKVVSASIELLLEDLYLFHDLKPNDADFLSASEIERGIELHGEFVSERFVIRDGDGLQQKPTAMPTVTFQRQPDGVALPELMSHKLTFDLQYKFEAPIEFLTFEQQFSGNDAVLPAEMMLTVQQEGAGELLKKSLVSGHPETLRIDWSGNRPDEDASEEQRKKWLAEQANSTLGLSSYSSIYSFLYIDDYEVRHEILIPLMTLQESIELPRNDRAFLSPVEQDAIAGTLSDHFLKHNPIQIDGDLRVPTVVQCRFVGVNFRDLAQQAQRRSVAMASGRVGIILSYPLDRPAQTLRLKWDLFSESVFAVKVAVVEGESVRRVVLSKVGHRNVFDWSAQESPGPVPIQSVDGPLPEHQKVSWLKYAIGTLPFGLVCIFVQLIPKSRRRVALGLAACSGLLLVGIFPHKLTTPWSTPSISNECEAAVCHDLLPQIYEAFRYRSEERIYDALATTVHGELLQDVYLQLLNGLKMQQQGGAIARIDEIRITNSRSVNDDGALSPSSRPQFEQQCTWSVSGEVEHWGHRHRRENQFTGRLRIEWIDDRWSLAELNLLEERQLSYSTSVRQISDVQQDN